jgi:MoaA/NifB/PqqE/SkfB family radical SAM enzyme
MMGVEVFLREPNDATLLSQHPCFNISAVHRFARIHLPVAPACNVLCNFCCRKFDCINESRPGVTSRILTPEEACSRVIVAKGRMPELRVVGIAGPGDPLANPDATFRTFKLVREHFPDMLLCLSTNGLVLEDLVDQVVEAGVSTATVTVNALDLPAIQEIYHHVTFGRRGVPAPSFNELEAARRRAAAHVPVMRHCRQCRADAVGLLYEDRCRWLDSLEVCLNIGPRSRSGLEEAGLAVYQVYDRVENAVREAAKAVLTRE